MRNRKEFLVIYCGVLYKAGADAYKTDPVHRRCTVYRYFQSSMSARSGRKAILWAKTCEDDLPLSGAYTKGAIPAA